MLIPEQYGGLDFDLGTYLLVLEELAWGNTSVALSVAIHNGSVAGLLRWHGSDEQKQRWATRARLVRIARCVRALRAAYLVGHASAAHLPPVVKTPLLLDSSPMDSRP